MSPARAGYRFVVALLIAVCFSVGVAGTASAHDVLISSNPADNSTVGAAPSAITFTFDQPIQNFDPVVSLVGPDGRQYVTGTPTISGNVITGAVGSGPAGRYTAAYRIVSADGHPVTGEIHFNLTGGTVSGGPTSPGGTSTAVSGSTAAAAVGTGSPATTAASRSGGSATVEAATNGTSSGGLSAGLWIGLTVAALVIAAAAVVLLRRPGKEQSADRDY